MESILSKDACKVGLPTLERLMLHSFWNENVPKFNEKFMSGNDATKQSLKLTNNAKEQIKITMQRTEQRLRDEQKSVSLFHIFFFVYLGLKLSFFYSPKQ